MRPFDVKMPVFRQLGDFSHTYVQVWSCAHTALVVPFLPLSPSAMVIICILEPLDWSYFLSHLSVMISIPSLHFFATCLKLFFCLILQITNVDFSGMDASYPSTRIVLI